MMQLLTTITPWILAFVILVLACRPWWRPARPVWLAVCLLYIVMDGAVTLAGLHMVPGLRWNWAGKAFSVALAVAAILIVRPTRQELPWTLPGSRAGWGWIIGGIAAACLFSGGINFMFRDHTMPGLETIAYEATMPGLAEELCWRGLVFVFLGRAYEAADDAANLAPAAFVSTMMFGLIHGINVDNGSARFAWLPFGFALTLGAGLAVLRLRAKSIPGLIAVHNSANVVGNLLNGVA